MSASDILNDVLTLSQAASLIGRSEQTFRTWREQKLGPPGYWHGRSLVYLRHEVLQWIDKHRHQLENRQLPID
ncbi:MAG: helix-turn-helix domain-containing protein [Magnetococcales bacterium]|nr:helix-turn-helix domain-containing protein [Magnetococcales bacterium]MBF0583683.1 helix-turn-helix domain-containing protein [Magnetococcales bacterium]